MSSEVSREEFEKFRREVRRDVESIRHDVDIILTNIHIFEDRKKEFVKKIQALTDENKQKENR